MERAIAAARRAFDETDWSTNRAFRKRCLQQLKDALDRERETLRAQIVAEVGAPIVLTYAVQMDSCIDDMQWDIDLLDAYEWEHDLPVHEFIGMRSARRVFARADRRRRRDHAVELPVHAQPVEARPRARRRQHDGPEARARHAVERDVHRPHRGRADRHPAGRAQHRGVGRQGRRSARSLTGDPRVDIVSFTGSTAVGKRIMARGADTLKKVFLELGGKSANIILDDADLAATMPSGRDGVHRTAGQGCAITTRMLLPASRYDEGVEMLKAAFETFTYGDPTDAGQPDGPADQRSAARPRPRLHREGQGRGGAPARRRRPPGAARPRATSSSRRCSSTSIPTRRSRRRRSSGRCSRSSSTGRRRRRPHRQQLALRPLGRGRLRVARPGLRGGPAASGRARSR